MILMLVTSRRQLSPAASPLEIERCLVRQAEAAVEAGVDMIQIREPDMDTARLVDVARAFAAAARGTSTRVLVNDRVDVALAAGAGGVHLPGRGLPPARVRSVVPAGFTIGRSVHAVADLQAAAGADFVVAGTVYRTTSKPSGHPILGCDGLRAIVAASPVPVLGIGGIGASSMSEIAGAGAAGVAGIGLFLADADAPASSCRATSLTERVRAWRAMFDTRGTRFLT